LAITDTNDFRGLFAAEAELHTRQGYGHKTASPTPRNPPAECC
jgi:hypothetical protein